MKPMALLAGVAGGEGDAGEEVMDAILYLYHDLSFEGVKLLRKIAARLVTYASSFEANQ